MADAGPPYDYIPLRKNDLGLSAPELSQFSDLLIDVCGQLDALQLRYMTPKHYLHLLGYLRSLDWLHDEIATEFRDDELEDRKSVAQAIKEAKMFLRERAIALSIPKDLSACGPLARLKPCTHGYNSSLKHFMRSLDRTRENLLAILNTDEWCDLGIIVCRAIEVRKLRIQDFASALDTPSKELEFAQASRSYKTAEAFYLDASPWTTKERRIMEDTTTLEMVRRSGDVITAPSGLPLRMTYAFSCRLSEDGALVFDSTRYEGKPCQ